MVTKSFDLTRYKLNANESRILVIGAGVSGLAAARALNQRKFDVTVIEARDRIGGRVYTRNNFDYGAHWIRGTEGNPVTDFARRHSLPIRFVGGDSAYLGGWEQLLLYRAGRGALSAEEKLRSILRADEIREAIDDWRRQQSLARNDEDMPFGEAARSLMERKLSAQTKIAPETLWHLLALARDDIGGGLDRLSALWWDDGHNLYGYGDSIFVDGFGAFVEKLSEGLKIALSQKVRSIHYGRTSPPRVRVVTDSGEFTGDAVIVTLPLGVLKAESVRFDPPLPPEKQRAISRLGYGCAAKMGLTFPEVFWPAKQYAFGYLEDAMGNQPTHILNSWRIYRRAELVLLIGGESARLLEAMTPTDAAAFGMRILREMFGSHIPNPLAVRKTVWSRDEFACGANSYIAVGSHPSDLETLAAPVGETLFFAGEATSRNCWATVHGAYLSGLREATRITGDASILPERTPIESRRWREMLHRAGRFFRLRSGALTGDELAARVALLRESEVFRDLGQAETKILATMFDWRALSDGELLCHEGDEAKEVYLIASGQLDVCVGAGRTRVARVERPAVVGEYGLFTNARRNATLVAVGETLVLTLDYARFTRFLLAFPESTLVLLRMVVRQFMEQSKKAAG